MRQIFQQTGGSPPYTAEHRAEQLRRLEGLGNKPSKKELGATHVLAPPRLVGRPRPDRYAPVPLTLVSPNPNSYGEYSE